MRRLAYAFCFTRFSYNSPDNRVLIAQKSVWYGELNGMLTMSHGFISNSWHIYAWLTISCIKIQQYSSVSIFEFVYIFFLLGVSSLFITFTLSLIILFLEFTLNNNDSGNGINIAVTRLNMLNCKYNKISVFFFPRGVELFQYCVILIEYFHSLIQQ